MLWASILSYQEWSLGGGGRCSSSAEVAPTVHYLETPSTRSNALLDITGEAGDD